jgi:hypothetical protein
MCLFFMLQKCLNWTQMFLSMEAILSSNAKTWLCCPRTCSHSHLPVGETSAARCVPERSLRSYSHIWCSFGLLTLVSQHFFTCNSHNSGVSERLIMFTRRQSIITGPFLYIFNTKMIPCKFGHVFIFYDVMMSKQESILYIKSRSQSSYLWSQFSLLMLKRGCIIQNLIA